MEFINRNKAEKVTFSRNQGNMLPFPLWEALMIIYEINKINEQEKTK